MQEPGPEPGPNLQFAPHPGGNWGGNWFHAGSSVDTPHPTDSGISMFKCCKTDSSSEAPPKAEDWKTLTGKPFAGQSFSDLQSQPPEPAQGGKDLACLTSPAQTSSQSSTSTTGQARRARRRELRFRSRTRRRQNSGKASPTTHSRLTTCRERRSWKQRLRS